jgi:hypothetical protein
MTTSAALTVSPPATTSDATELRDWLSRESMVRTARVSPDASDPESQGGMLATISLVLADGASLVALVDTVRRWLETGRRKDFTVTLQSGHDSTTVVIQSARSR